MHSLGKEVSTTCYEKWDRIFDVIDGWIMFSYAKNNE
jgi:hypothetical protein